MTPENLNKLKFELYQYYVNTNDITTLINEACRLGRLYELTKDSDKECTMDDVFDLFDKEY